jgi:hypothetical protein|tara:strand:- start:68 stop:328 length:261 start_codon:yes stop_codon:yes gene_type:complete
MTLKFKKALKYGKKVGKQTGKRISGLTKRRTKSVRKAKTEYAKQFGRRRLRMGRHREQSDFGKQRLSVMRESPVMKLRRLNMRYKQ